MKALKIGILTFHRCINYGSYWQAMALAEGLKGRGHDVVILDHYARHIDIAEWKCALQPLLPAPVPYSDQALYSEKIKGFFRAFEDMPLSSRFPIDDPEVMEECDIVVVGSDEVWNFFHPWYCKQPIFFGTGLNAKRVIAYSASFGNYPSNYDMEWKWAEQLRNFDMISVRDRNSQELVERATGATPELVLDPCLQFPIVPADGEHPILNKKYIAAYGHSFSPSFIRDITQQAKTLGLPMISIGYRNDWADEQWITADPIQFRLFMSRAAAVVTNFFHGSIFALHYQKPFACEAMPYRLNKIMGLLSKIQGEQHLVSESTTSQVFTQLLTQPPDQNIYRRIEQFRKVSDAYLTKALVMNKVNHYEST